MPVLTHPPVISLSPSLQSPSRLLQRSSGSLHNSLYFTVLTHPPVISLPSSLHCSSVSLHSNVAPSVPPLPILPPPPVILSLDHSSTRRYRFTRLSLYPIIACPYPSSGYIAPSIYPLSFLTHLTVIRAPSITLLSVFTHPTVFFLHQSVYCPSLPLHPSFHSLCPSTARPYSFNPYPAPSVPPLPVLTLPGLDRSSRSLDPFTALPYPFTGYPAPYMHALSVLTPPRVISLPPSLHSPSLPLHQSSRFVDQLYVLQLSSSSLHPSTACTYPSFGLIAPLTTLLPLLTP